MSEGLTARIAAAVIVRDQILATPLESRDMSRLHDVLAAIDHNKRLLEGSI